MNLKYITPEIHDHILQTAHSLHRQPEISNQEYKTTEFLFRELKKLDIEIPESQPSTGVIGLLRGKLPGPTIALRADIDALPIDETPEHEIKSEIPNVMHACGHDFHTASLLGAAMALSSRREELTGNVLFLFQPAEEQCGGALEIISTGIFDQYPPSAFFSLHVMPDIPLGRVGIRPGPMMAAQACFRIRICGKGGHGALPHLSKNPIIAAARIIDALQWIRAQWADPTEPFALSVCSIHGGSACNIIPDAVELEGTYRYALDSYGQEVKQHVIRIAEAAALSHGCTAECSFFREIFPLVNDNHLTNLARTAASGIFGENNLFIQDFRMISEDFGFYRKVAPIFMYHVGTGAQDGSSPGLHNFRFLVPDDAGALCAELMTATALEALQHTQL